ncbi:hypothetical protein ACETK8_17030 [Brevundimonas staleyi]|uniref:RHS repeat protein n=1 Tax=Brevundimonas staleyi TaxID=74326 RepID=A0ABW0FWT1_9CAUL
MARTTTSYTTPGSFTPLQKRHTLYDDFLRPLRISDQTAVNATLALRQMTYDASGRVRCAATRMNPSQFGALPASACDASTQGDFGPDRITRYGYDGANRLISTTTGIGRPVSEQIVESLTYTLSGQIETLTDGNGNLSTLEYDGFDRLSSLRYPNASGGGSSTTDRENYSYDNNGNATGFTSRAGQTFTTTYDALNRPIALSGTTTTPAYTYTYDQLGRQLTASKPGDVTPVSHPAITRVLW